MKKIIKIVSVFTLLAFTACNVDNDKLIVASKDAANIVSPDQGSSIVLNPSNATNPALTVVWNHAKYTQATQVKYVIEVAKGGSNFANFKSVIVPDGQRQMSWNVTQLNGLVTQVGLLPFTAGDLDIRIKSSLGVDNSLESVSEKITVSITPFTTEKPSLAVPGNHQGWNPPTAPRLKASAYGKTDFEGFVWLDGGYKFVTANATGGFEWNQSPDFADDGTFSGVLKDGTGETNCNATAGYYYVKANVGAVTATNPDGLKYSSQPTSWGIAGNATTNGWDGSMPMTYDSATKKWTIITTLSTQAAPNNGLKFKANGGWDLNFGDTGADGSAEFNGTNIGTTAGSYKITLDLSNPRDYKYTIVPN
jgi:starch-binding outer membrane protein SusE/F